VSVTLPPVHLTREGRLFVEPAPTRLTRENCASQPEELAPPTAPVEPVTYRLLPHYTLVYLPPGLALSCEHVTVAAGHGALPLSVEVTPAGDLVCDSGGGGYRVSGAGWTLTGPGDAAGRLTIPAEVRHGRPGALWRVPETGWTLATDGDAPCAVSFLFHRGPAPQPEPAPEPAPPPAPSPRDAALHAALAREDKAARERRGGRP
jgi:hypothetical protein